MNQALLFFALLYIPSLLAECDAGRCSSCTEESEFNVSCRWCPKNNICWPYGDPYNTCSSSEQITHHSDCPPDPPRTTAYNQDDATIMLQYASAAYSTDFHANKTFPQGFETFANLTFPFPDGTTGHTFIGVVDRLKHIAIAFDGTQNVKQLIHEGSNITFEAFSDMLPGAKASGYFLAGFHAAYNILESHLLSALDKYPDYDVWITGHSLGGSIAALYTLQLTIEEEFMNKIPGNRIKLYTFGEPRCGNKQLASAINERVKDAFRVVNDRDIVPHIPPCNDNPLASGCKSGWGYHHGTEIWYAQGDYKGGNMCWYRECTADPFGEDSSCSNQWETDDINDHYGYWDVLFNGGWCGSWKSSKLARDLDMRRRPDESLVFNQTEYAKYLLSFNRTSKMHITSIVQL